MRLSGTDHPRKTGKVEITNLSQEIDMICLRCKSHMTVKFIDGFGNRRVFCKSCGRSFLEYIRILPNGQKNLMGFETEIYYRPGIISVK